MNYWKIKRRIKFRFNGDCVLEDDVDLILAILHISLIVGEYPFSLIKVFIISKISCSLSVILYAPFFIP